MASETGRKAAGLVRIDLEVGRGGGRTMWLLMIWIRRYVEFGNHGFYHSEMSINISLLINLLTENIRTDGFEENLIIDKHNL